jgi:hypothetical protein
MWIKEIVIFFVSLFRDFVGPLIGGGLAGVVSFPTSCVILGECFLAQVSISLGDQSLFRLVWNNRGHFCSIYCTPKQSWISLKCCSGFQINYCYQYKGAWPAGQLHGAWQASPCSQLLVSRIVVAQCAVEMSKAKKKKSRWCGLWRRCGIISSSLGINGCGLTVALVHWAIGGTF